MMNYSMAVALSLILCMKFSTTYPMLDCANARRFKNFRIAFIVLLPLTFVAAFRWDVGVDSLYYGSYWKAYRAAADGDNYENFEFLFFWFMRIFSTLKVPYFWFLFTHCMIFMSCVCYSIYKGSIWTAWSIVTFFLLFIYFDCFSSLRQSLAEGFCMIAWAKMGADERSLKKDVQIILLILFASLFHSIALINLPIYFICKIRMPRNNYVLFLIIAVLATPFLQVAIRSIMRLIAGDQYEFVGLALINTVTSGFVCILCWVFYEPIMKLGKNAHVYLNFAACIFILILNSGAMFLPYRVYDMLKIGYVFIVPYILRSLNNRWNKLFVPSLVALVFGILFLNAFVLQNSYAIYYRSVFINFNTLTRLP